ncbi:MAG: hypothetical protein K2X03_03860 [Bryobacteraceae bacterium]|nr:hypothetical protein [Bryobacteraceae bacterium]
MPRLALFIALTALPLLAQRHKAPDSTPEILAISSEPDPARKLAMLEKLGVSTGWALSQMQQLYFKAGNFDKALETGDKLLGLDPQDWEAGLVSLQAAVGKKDSDTVLKLAPLVTAGAKRAAQEPKKASDSEEQAQYMATLTKDAVAYAEYAYSAVALAEQNPAKAVQVIEAFEKQNPQSQYFASTVPKYVYAARQANLLPSLFAFADRAWARGAFSEELLLTVADSLLQQSKEPEKVVQYAEKAAEVLTAKPKPEGMADADWDKKKSASLGLAYWMAGTTLASQNKAPQADKDLRAALPFIKDNDQLNGTALFYLGLMNYQMGKGKNPAQMAEALSFMQQSAAIKGPVQAKAIQNLALMKREAPAPKKK